MTILYIILALALFAGGFYCGFRYARIQKDLKDKAERITEVIKS